MQQEETQNFQAEVRQVLHLMINSLYSNKEIFLRELISNGSDACDKLRFEALSDEGLYEGDSDLGIRIEFDKERRTVTVSDNGIGMSREEVTAHIGTIAKSGTQEFFQSLTGDQARDSELIGQFGVGFYSVFIVADRVTLTTRRAGQPADAGVKWVSDGQGTYTINNIDMAERGTRIVLHLKEDEDEFLDDYRLRSVVRKFSDHISLPISMAKQSIGEDDDAEAGDEVVNSASALWSRARNEITPEEYNEFYKHVSHDPAEPLAHVHSRVEGKHEYISLLYIPSHAPFDLWDPKGGHGIKLYVRRVFIMDDAEHLMPHYLRFVRGVMDTSDLPLNVSREILQSHRLIDTIRGASVKKVLGLLEDLVKNDSEKYAGFWETFGRVLKEGPAEDFANRERIAALLRFASTHTDSKTEDVSLATYIDRMKDGQESIYYITADSFAAAKNSPHLEVFRKKGIEVLLLSDRVDEWLVSHLVEFDGKPLTLVTRGELDIDKIEDVDSDAEPEINEEAFEGLVERLGKTLGERVKSVRTTRRLTTSPACLVADEQDMGANLERIMKAAGQDVPVSLPIFEINPQHPLVQNLAAETDDGRFEDLASILMDQAVLSEGGQLDDPSSFIRKLNRLLLQLTKESTS